MPYNDFVWNSSYEYSDLQFHCSGYEKRDIRQLTQYHRAGSRCLTDVSVVDGLGERWSIIVLVHDVYDNCQIDLRKRQAVGVQPFINLSNKRMSRGKHTS